MAPRLFTSTSEYIVYLTDLEATEDEIKLYRWATVKYYCAVHEEFIIDVIVTEIGKRNGESLQKLLLSYVLSIYKKEMKNLTKQSGKSAFMGTADNNGEDFKF